jgi:alpha-D-ribose 1-methylphosphonate 5-triphosphate synthase subunit PhnH
MMNTYASMELPAYLRIAVTSQKAASRLYLRFQTSRAIASAHNNITQAVLNDSTRNMNGITWAWNDNPSVSFRNLN